MRALLTRLCLVLSLAALASSQTPTARPADLEGDVLVRSKSEAGNWSVAYDDTDETPKSTTFNGIEVPPMKDMIGDTFNEDMKNGYWFVKHYSPYCHHCRDIAPTWQTLYEFYYTSKPVPSSHKAADNPTSLNAFQAYYNFRFSSIDCVTWGDACNDHDIKAFPTFILYKDSKEVDRFAEKKKNMETLSKFVEEHLESIKPGSRPANGLMLPEPGATSVEGDTPAIAEGKDRDAAAGLVSGEQHQNIGSLTAAEEFAKKSASAAEKLKKISTTPNPAGKSIALTQESFQKLVTTSQDSWFIKFYAPWCHHCQALAPNWAQMSKELQGKLNVGEVNCDVESRLCKDVGVKAYPVIHFFRGGERVEYDGLRGLGDLVSYTRKAIDVGSGVTDVSAAAFKELEETEEVIFIYFYDEATTSEDFKALDRLTLSLIGHARLVKTDNVMLAERYKIHTWPRLIVSRDGRPSYFNALAPKDMRDFRKVLNWMQSVWLPIVPELTAVNSREIMHDRIVVLGILSRDNADEFILDKREIKNAALEWMDKETHNFQLERQELRDAKQLRIEEAEDRNDQRALRSAKSMRIQIMEEDRKRVGFAWIDGVFWERWIRTTYGLEVKDGHRVIINDEESKRYWDVTASGGYIVPSRTSILETLPKVVSDPPKLSPKYTTGKIHQLFLQLREKSRGHPWLSIMVAAGGLGYAATWGRRRIRRAKGGAGFFQLDGKESMLNGGTGKVD